MDVQEKAQLGAITTRPAIRYRRETAADFLRAG
jgi:hypothetical protein